jgi:DNA-binding NarL/FixJ family response regulator
MRMILRQSAAGSECLERIAVSPPPKADAHECIRIGWISSSRLTRECMTEAVSRAYPSSEILSFRTAFDCVTFSTTPFDLIVFHSRGPGMSDLRELTELRRVFPAGKLLVMSDSASIDPALVQRILAEGASGFILTGSNSLEMFISAIRLVTSGGTFVSREFFMVERPSPPPMMRSEVQHTHRITQRERSVLELIKHGKPNKIIAHELGLSVCTVKIHTRNLIQKMGAANRTQAAVNADKFL